ncbi:MAG: hypothetical protein IPK80_26220 [Nannocystis sp.]|nr:hypothetical protein [Nannocystis sp.]MBK8264822.1 hypothetical protein [Nannocystis sp.]
MCSKSTRQQLLAMTRFDFTFLAGAASQTLVIVPGIDVSAYYRAQLLIRLHASSMSSGQSVVLELDHTLPSDEDPAEFIDRGATGSPLLSVTIDSTHTPPLLRSGEVTGLQAALRVRLVATQTSTPQIPFFVEISVVLVLRDS